MTAPDQLHARFLSILPRLEAHAIYCFRHVQCPAKKADWIADTIALAWKWFVRLDSCGKNALNFSTILGAFAVRAVRHGRRVQGMERARDVMNTRAQARARFRVERWTAVRTSRMLFAEALADNTATPPPDAAAFRIDFPRWLRTLRGRDRRLALALMMGEGTLDAAQIFQVSPARVSQLRRQLADDWAQFHGENAAAVVNPRPKEFRIKNTPFSRMGPVKP